MVELLNEGMVHISVTVGQAHARADPHHALTTLHPGRIAHLPGQEASSGEGQSSFDRAGAHAMTFHP